MSIFRHGKARPLVVFTPKGLLRLPRATSSLEDLTSGSFKFVLDDPRAEDRRDKVERLVLCSGKVYVDLISSERRREAGNVAIGRVEQLYPFPNVALGEVLAGYPALREIVWVQEEPENMGAWSFVRQAVEELAGSREVFVAARPASSSPAEGSAARHHQIQQQLIARAFGPSEERRDRRRTARGRGQSRSARSKAGVS